MSAAASRPLTQAFHVRGGTVAQPAVELGLILELLTALSRHGYKPAIDFRQRGHVAPQFFKLRDRKNILLVVALAGPETGRSKYGRWRSYSPARAERFSGAASLAGE